MNPDIDKAIENLIEAANKANRPESGNLYERIERVNVAREKLRQLIEREVNNERG